MPRQAQDDFIQAFRFHVTSDSFLDPVAGFNSVTIPELSVEAAEYRAGNRVYTRKQPGPPTVADVTLSQGVARAGTPFWDSIQAYLNGSEFRFDFSIKNYHHYDLIQAGGIERKIPDDVVSSKIVSCFNAFCIRAKILGDLDATSSEISLREADFAIEYFEFASD